MAVSDLSTALDHVLVDPLTENKFQALKILHAKKIKSLMTSIDTQQKEIAKLKTLSKDNRRTQMIQSLKKKLKEQEFVSDVLKEELGKKAELSREEVCDYVVRKTISGPKRFRPLTREELELQIIELEKKVKTKSAQSSVSSIERSTKETSSNVRKSTPTSAPEEKDDIQSLSRISELESSLTDSNQLCERREIVINQLKEEISRLRATNSQLMAVEEERDNIERQFNDLTLRYERVVEELEDALHKAGLYQEEAFQTRSECEMELEQQAVEIEGLREQCEKGLKQNTQLLRRMAELESHYDRNQRVNIPDTISSIESESLNRSNPLQNQLKTANARIVALENQLKSSLSNGSQSVAELNSLKTSLRGKNETIRELKRTIAEMSRLSRSLKDSPSISSPSSSPLKPSSLAESKSETSSKVSDAKKGLTSPGSGKGPLGNESDRLRLLTQFIDSLLSYELASPSSHSPGTLTGEIVNTLLTSLSAVRTSQMRGGEGVSVKKLQSFEHVLLLRHPGIAIGPDDEDEDELSGMRIVR